MVCPPGFLRDFFELCHSKLICPPPCTRPVRTARARIHTPVGSFYLIINAGITELSLRGREAFCGLLSLEIRLYGVVDLPGCLKVATTASDALETLSFDIAVTQ